jgi:hypothetical protein
MEPFGITMFCDDIRFEQFGKISLIGCYGPELHIFGDLPTVIPKLGFFVQLRFPNRDMSSLRILIYFPDNEEEPKNTFDFSSEITRNISSVKSEQIGDIQPLFAINFPIVFNGLELKTEGYFKVRILYDDKILRAGALKVVRNPPIPTPGQFENSPSS